MTHQRDEKRPPRVHANRDPRESEKESRYSSNKEKITTTRVKRLERESHFQRATSIEKRRERRRRGSYRETVEWARDHEIYIEGAHRRVLILLFAGEYAACLDRALI